MNGAVLYERVEAADAFAVPFFITLGTIILVCIILHEVFKKKKP